MNTDQILMCLFALILGMLLANMLKGVCGCKVVEGQNICSDNNNSSHFCDYVLGPGVYNKIGDCTCP